MKIVIIGFDGQLGMDCQKILAPNHHLITPTLAELDLCDQESVDILIATEKPEVVINCAAFTAVDNCEKEEELSWKINAAGPEFLAKACEKAQARLIQVSTDYVFDGNKPVPQSYSETDEINPLSQYGRSKLAGEEEVQKHCSDFAILRTAWLYSAHGPNFLKTMLRITLADPGAVRKVVDDQYGSLTWSFTLAKQIEILLTSDIQGVVHTTSEGYSTWYSAACYFLNTMGVEHSLTPCATSDYPTPAHRPTNSILENSVLEEKGISVFVDWKEDIDTFVANFKEKLLQEMQQK
jgi:dTDP-4-dehydrorhamnose reductase